LPILAQQLVDLHPDVIASIRVGADRKSVDIVLASTEVPKVHPRQTPRVYHASLASQTLFESNAPAKLDAYYSLQRFPDATK
jgi:hypothetical protein